MLSRSHSQDTVPREGTKSHRKNGPKFLGDISLDISEGRTGKNAHKHFHFQSHFLLKLATMSKNVLLSNSIEPKNKKYLAAIFRLFPQR